MKLDKSQRETDWSKSVLSSEQLQCELPSSCPVTTEDIYIMIRRGDRHIHLI
jgi:hypothetical protein